MPKRYDNSRVLVFSCMHIPYHHKDAFKFLRAVKHEYSPDRVINLGDTIDNNSISFHPKDPDLMSPGEELKQARRYLKELEEIFPIVEETKSNHGQLVHRKMISVGLPRGLIKDYNKIYDLGDGWKFHTDLSITTPDRNQWYFCHGKASNAYIVSKNISGNVACGHHHNQFSIQSWMDVNNRVSYGVQVGTLIDDYSYAFNYNKSNVYKPLLGVTVILDGIPILIPMRLAKSGRWRGI